MFIYTGVFFLKNTNFEELSRGQTIVGLCIGTGLKKVNCPIESDFNMMNCIINFVSQVLNFKSLHSKLKQITGIKWGVNLKTQMFPK